MSCPPKAATSFFIRIGHRWSLTKRYKDKVTVRGLFNLTKLRSISSNICWKFGLTKNQRCQHGGTRGNTRGALMFIWEILLTSLQNVLVDVEVHCWKFKLWLAGWSRRKVNGQFMTVCGLKWQSACFLPWHFHHQRNLEKIHYSSHVCFHKQLQKWLYTCLMFWLSLFVILCSC